MSERGGALGPFLLGVVIGAALGALFAPDAGEVTRGQLRRKLRGLRDLAEEKAGELTALVAPEDDDEEEAAAEPEPAAGSRSAREELEQRLADARRRRRQAKRARAPDEEDEPVE